MINKRIYVKMTDQQRLIFDEISKSYPEGVTAKEIIRSIYGARVAHIDHITGITLMYSGRDVPSEARIGLATQLHHIRNKLRSHGFTISKPNPIGPVEAIYKLETIED